MVLSSGEIDNVLARFFRRAEAARSAGGISRLEIEDGRAVIPEGWKQDYELDYWLPPNVTLL